MTNEPTELGQDLHCLYCKHNKSGWKCFFELLNLRSDLGFQIQTLHSKDYWPGNLPIAVRRTDCT